MVTTTTFDNLIEEYYETYGGEDFIKVQSIAAISDAIIGDPIPYLRQVFEGFEGSPPSPVEIQEKILDLYKTTRDIQYLQAYNEISIRAQKMNKGRETFPISSTYPKFEAILRRNGLTLEDLAIERDTLLNISIKT